MTEKEPNEITPVARKLLGPSYECVTEELRRANTEGLLRMFATASAKTADIDDGRAANLRVLVGSILNGSVASVDEVCAQYFGGILASSRSDDGKDDSAIEFVSTVTSMSSKQLHLHYVIYHQFNQLAVAQGWAPDQEFWTEYGALQHGESFFAGPINIDRAFIWILRDDAQRLGLSFDDMHALSHRGLVGEYRGDMRWRKEPRGTWFWLKPTTAGVRLYCAAHNRSGEWMRFCHIDMGSSPGIGTLGSAHLVLSPTRNTWVARPPNQYRPQDFDKKGFPRKDGTTSEDGQAPST